MLSLSSNFEDILIANNAIEGLILIKIQWHKYPASNTNHYFSTKWFTITDSGTKQVKGLLFNDNIQIQQSINIREHTSTVGGFSIDLIDNGLNAIFNDYLIHNEDIYVYYGTEDLTSLSDWLLLYKGIATDYETQNGIITINVENSTFTVQKELPLTVIKESDFPYLCAEASGKSIPILYGDRRFSYGEDPEDLTDGTMELTTSSQQNIMSKCVYLGSTDDGKHQFAVCSHDLNEINEEFSRFWMFDSSLQKYVMINPDNCSASVEGDNMILEVDALKNVTVFDYRYPIAIANDSGNLVDWADIANGIDVDYTTDTYITIGSASVDGEIEILFPPLENNINEDNIVDIIVRGMVDNDFVTGTADQYNCNSAGDTNNILAYDDSHVEDLLTYSTQTIAKINAQVDFFAHKGTDPVGSQTWKLFMCYKRVEYKPAQLYDVYCACKGREADATVAGLFSGLSSGDLLENPVHIYADILINYLGLTSDQYNATDLQTVATALSSWKFAPKIIDPISSYDFLNEFCKQSKCISIVDSANDFNLDHFASSYTTDKEIKLNEVDFESIKTYRTKLSDIINKLKFRYIQDGNGSLQEIIERIDDRGSGSGSDYIYNVTQELSIDAPFIRDDTTAGLLADHWCKNDADSFWSVQRHFIEFKTSDLRGSNIYDGSGNFEPLMLLELGDIIELNDSEFDDIVLCNGVSWSGIQFKIISITRNKNDVNITAYEVD